MEDARGGAIAPYPSPLWKCCKVFLCIIYSKTISRRIIYALFSPPAVVGKFLPPQIPTGAPSWIPLANFRPQSPYLPPLKKNPAGAHATKQQFLVTALNSCRLDDSSVRRLDASFGTPVCLFLGINTAYRAHGWTLETTVVFKRRIGLTCR